VTKKGPTIKDVAKRAGVSIATVSNVINGTRFVSNELQQRVRAAVEELGYRPSAVGRSLRKGQTQSIGFLLPDPRNQFFQIVAEGIEEQAELHHNSVWYCNTRDEPSRERSCVSTMVSRGVDGIVIAPSPGAREALRPLMESGFPLVVIVRQIERLEVDQVFADSIEGAYEATRHLIELGHRRIGLLTGIREIQTFKERLFGHQKALLDHSIPFDPDLVLDAYSHVEEGCAATKHLLENTDVTAVFATNYPMTLGALKAIGELDLDCPGEISLIGFDDLDCAVVVRPHLTVVDQKPFAIGHTAGTMLFERINSTGGSQPAARIVKIPPEVVIRESAAKPALRKAG
jgi:DNA-binding LacI/PurR family transcriptional regulator